MMRVGANVVDGLSVTVKEKEMQEMIRRISLSVLLMGLVTATVREAVRGEGLHARLRWSPDKVNATVGRLNATVFPRRAFSLPDVHLTCTQDILSSCARGPFERRSGLPCGASPRAP